MSSFLSYMHHHVFVYILMALFLSAITTAFSYKKNLTLGLIHYSNNNIKSNFFQNLLIPTIMSVIFVCIWYWIVFLPLDFGHRDEIALLTAPLRPTMYSGRFFPMGHMEFNILSLQRTGGKLSILYLLPFAQLVLFGFLVDKIVQPSGFVIRVYAILSAFFLAAIVPFSNLIIPERNVIFLLVAGLYFVKTYYEKPTFLNSILAVLFLSLALYYKEPTFAALFSFVFVIVLYRFVGRFTIPESKNTGTFMFKLFGPIEIGLMISIIFFLVGYFFYVYYGGGPESYYVGGGIGGSIFKKVSLYFIDNPILLGLIIIIICANFFIPGDNFERVFTVAISLAAIAYLLALVTLGFSANGYYYSIPLLLMSIASSLLFKHAALSVRGLINYRNRQFGRSVFVAGVGLFLLYAISAVSLKMFVPISNDIIQKKNYQNEYSFLKTEMLKIDKIDSIYYAPRTKQFNDYATAVLMIFLHKENIDHNFNIYSESGCAVWNETYNKGQIKCVKKNYKNFDEYDVLVIENDTITQLDTNKYNIVKHISPFGNNDHTRNTLTVAVKIIDTNAKNNQTNQDEK